MRTDQPTQYASFALRFRTDGSLGAERPISASLVDRETHTVTVRTGNPARTPDWDVGDADAWQIGRDIGGTVYVLTIPRVEPATSEALAVQVTQVFGGGRAQWVNEFSCVRR